MDGVTNDNSIESYLEGSDSDPIIDNYNMFDLRYCNWQKDLFHGLVPHQQYGTSAVVQTSDAVAGSPSEFSILALRQAANNLCS